MKILSFRGERLRDVMEKVRRELGDMAVILTSSKRGAQHEVVAAVDYDEAVLRAATMVAAKRQEEDRPANAEAVAREPDEGRADITSPAPMNRQVRDGSPSTALASPESDDFLDARAISELLSMPSSSAPRIDAEPVIRRAPMAAVVKSTGLPRAAEAMPEAMTTLVHQAIEDTARVREDLSSLRELLETQLAALVWNDEERRQPLRARILREFTRIGVEPDVARRLIENLPEGISPEQARYLPLGLMSRSLAIADPEMSDRPSVTALVGPTGVGKTTTLAKLAAQAVQRHGASQVALVSMDHYRIGAAAQLEHYARLLDVRVYPAYEADSLRSVLDMLKSKHTVLVDTAGLAAGDERLEAQLAVLREGSRDLRVCLALAANATAASLDSAVRAYLPVSPDSVILTKLDEAPTLGGALSVVIRHGLPLEYVTDGQRVPEDIATADARALVCRAAGAAQKLKLPAPDDFDMAERFGRMKVATA